MENREISKAVITRLPRYYRYLGELLESGVERISSNELSTRMKVTASQIRQDLNNFGGFGQQGYGYNVKYLYTEIGKILGIDRQHNLIIIGAGNLGQAIANYANFEKRGFMIKGMFDINPRLIGLVVRGIEIRGVDDLEQFIKDNDVQMAALTIPKTKAPELADRLVNAGIKGIWNFAHLDLNVPEDVVVENVHPEGPGIAGQGLADSPHAEDPQGLADRALPLVFEQACVQKVPLPHLLIVEGQFPAESQKEGKGHFRRRLHDAGRAVGDDDPLAAGIVHVDMVIANSGRGNDLELFARVQKFLVNWQLAGDQGIKIP